LIRKGVAESKVNFLSIGYQSSRIKALVAGKLDATILHMERAVQASNLSKDVHIIEPLAQYLRDVPMSYHAATTKWLNVNPNFTRAFTKAMIQSARFAVKNEPAMVEVGLKLLGKKGLNAADIGRVYDTCRNSGVWGPNGGITQAGYDAIVKLGIQMGDLKNPKSFKQVIDLRYMDEVLKELGRVNLN
jgi:ABC-type nitrate/sulfonate/bicarbonate transport system substrate-binding protein